MGLDSPELSSSDRRKLRVTETVDCGGGATGGGAEAEGEEGMKEEQIGDAPEENPAAESAETTNEGKGGECHANSSDQLPKDKEDSNGTVHKSVGGCGC